MAFVGQIMEILSRTFICGCVSETDQWKCGARAGSSCLIQRRGRTWLGRPPQGQVRPQGWSIVFWSCSWLHPPPQFLYLVSSSWHFWWGHRSPFFTLWAEALSLQWNMLRESKSSLGQGPSAKAGKSRCNQSPGLALGQHALEASCCRVTMGSLGLQRKQGRCWNENISVKMSSLHSSFPVGWRLCAHERDSKPETSVNSHLSGSSICPCCGHSWTLSSLISLIQSKNHRKSELDHSATPNLFIPHQASYLVSDETRLGAFRLLRPRTSYLTSFIQQTASHRSLFWPGPSYRVKMQRLTLWGPVSSSGWGNSIRWSQS